MWRSLVVCISVAAVAPEVTAVAPENIRDLRHPPDCAAEAGEFRKFFDESQLRCRPCSQNSTQQDVAADGLRCDCTATFRRTRDFAAGDITCEECPEGQVRSLGGWLCVSCAGNSTAELCPDCRHPDQVQVERDLDGSMTVPPERACVDCERNSTAADFRCARCDLTLRVRNDCDCPPEHYHGALCFNESLSPNFDETVRFGGRRLPSELLRFSGRAVNASCQRSNKTACQALGNLCAVLAFDLFAESTASTACALHREQHCSGQDTGSPCLYYEAGGADAALSDTSITAVYRDSSTPELVAAVYGLDGRFGGYEDGWRLLDGCGATTLRFGRAARSRCRLSVAKMFRDDEFQTKFFDLYWKYSDGDSGERLHSVPVLLRNLRDDKGNQPNRGHVRADWLLVRRLFTVDRVSTAPLDGSADADYVRYLSSVRLRITLRDDGLDGQIFPPFLEATFSEFPRDGAPSMVEFEISTSFEKSGKVLNRFVEIGSGVLTAVGVLYAAYAAHNWNSRNGRTAIDCSTIFKFLLFACDSISNSFLVVLVAFTSWNFIIYKFQNIMYLVPTDDEEYYLRAFLGSAFALKSIQVLDMLFVQTNVDIFFLDWESVPVGAKDKKKRKNQKKGNQHKTEQKQQEDSEEVSCWRTYLIANEWNELQTFRRIKPAMQYFLMLLLLEGIGLKHWAHFDTLRNTSDDTSDRGSYSQIFRFSLAVITFALVALGQSVAYSAVWSRFVHDPLQNFVDLCSLTNVSVLIMTHLRFGHYIHGKSVHGRADVSLREVCEAMAKEEQDLVPCRGLDPISDNQTFQIALPRRLRHEYDQIVQPIIAEMLRVQLQRRGNATVERLDEATLARIAGFRNLNNFLRAFIDHRLESSDYAVVRKSLAARMLDTEFEQCSDSLGYFYTDDGGHSFVETVFFGVERTLQTFEILLFALVDLLSGDFVLSASVAFLADLVLISARRSLGQKNLSKKAMIDERFLI